MEERYWHLAWKLIGLPGAEVTGGECEAVVQAEDLNEAKQKLAEYLKNEVGLARQSASIENPIQLERLPWYHKALSSDPDPISMSLLHSLQQIGLCVEIDAWRDPGTKN